MYIYIVSLNNFLKENCLFAWLPGIWGLPPGQSKDEMIQLSVTISQADRPCKKAGKNWPLRSKIYVDLP
jgi:hypothetical protein